MIPFDITPTTLRELESRSTEDLIDAYGSGQIVTRYAEATGWRQGDGPPKIVAETPAIAQAIGRCVTARLMKGEFRAILGQATGLHPTRCGWCDYPLGDLLAAGAHAVFVSRYIVAEDHVWPARHGEYRRETGRAGTYLNPAWAQFFVHSSPFSVPSERAEANRLRRMAIEVAA